MREMGMELLPIVETNSIAPLALLAEALRDAVPKVSESVVVPVPCLIAVAVCFAAAMIMSATVGRSKRIAERVMESLGCGVFVANLDGVLTYANQSFRQILDLGPENVIGKQMDKVLSLIHICSPALVWVASRRQEIFHADACIYATGSRDDEGRLELTFANHTRPANSDSRCV